MAISRLEAVPELARSYVERGWVESRCEQAKLEAHFEKLRGAWRAPPGVVEHMTYPHVLGPGSEWEGVDKPRRRAWVFRAIKPEHAQWYSQEWPHRMCPPSHAAKLYGERVGGPENVWG